MKMKNSKLLEFGLGLVERAMAVGEAAAAIAADATPRAEHVEPARTVRGFHRVPAPLLLVVLEELQLVERVGIRLDLELAEDGRPQSVRRVLVHVHHLPVDDQEGHETSATSHSASTTVPPFTVILLTPERDVDLPDLPLYDGLQRSIVCRKSQKMNARR